MTDQLIILAEGAAHSGGIHPAFVGLGMFAILMSLLGITFLFSGLNQGSNSPRATKAQRSGEVTKTEHHH